MQNTVLPNQLTATLPSPLPTTAVITTEPSPVPFPETLQPPPPQPTSLPRIPEKIAVVIQLWGDDAFGDSIEVLDQNFNFLYRIPSNDIHLTSFSPDGCYLRAINYQDEGFIIRELSIRGDETRRITALSKEAEDESEIYQFSLSPSGYWLAYKVVDQVERNVQGAKIQDVRLLRVDEQNPQEVLRLTERGGARPAGLSWSQDNRFVVYTDYDEYGITQIYVFSTEEGEEYQITHFDKSMKEHEVQVLSWSPDSQAIAFSVTGIRETDGGIEITNNGAIGIITVSGFKLKWLEFEGYENPILYNNAFPGSTTFWWSKDSQTLLIPFGLRTEETRTEYLAWYDLGLEKVVDILPGSNFPDLVSFWSAFPLEGINRIGIWGSNAVYIYDRDKEEIIKLEREYFLRENSVFIVPPNGPIDLVKCSK